MGWSCKLNTITKSGATAAIDGIDEADCLGDPADDADFAAHLSAAQSAAVAAVAGLTGSAALVDVAISCVPDNGPGGAGSYDVGAQITVIAVERY